MRFILLLSPHLYFFLLFFFHTSFALDFGSYAVSDKAPLAAILQRNSTSNRAIDTILRHFKQVDLATTQSSCALSIRRNGFFGDVRARWPERRHEFAGCVFEMELGGHGTEVWDSMTSILGALNNSAAEILRETNVGWDLVYARDAFQRFTDENCFILQSFGLRLDGVWHLRIRVTDTAPERFTSKSKGPGKREYMTEYVTRDEKSGNLVSIQRPVNDTAGNVMPRATTLLTVRRHSGGFFNVAEGPRGRHILFDFNRWHMFARETLLASNIGALVLPLVLALLPLPLFSETDTLMLILYSLLTDICNALPLAFKGIELLLFANNPPRSAQSMAFGLDVPSHIGGIRTWVMGCKTRENFSLIGSSFIVIALLAMALGIYLEVYTFRKQEYRKREDKLNNVAISNSTLVHLWAQERRCTKCTCYGDIYNERDLLQWSKLKRESRMNMIRYVPGIHSLLHHREE